MASSTTTPTTASGCTVSTNQCGISGRDWNTNTQVSRYSDSGSTQSSGAAATSVEICAVTATSSPDGTAARKIQRARCAHVSAGVLDSSTSRSAAASAGERNSSAPQPAIRTISTP